MTNEIYFEAFRRAMDVAVSVAGKFDNEKYVKATNELYGQDPQYSELNAQEELIKDAADLSTEKKIAYLKDITKQRNMIREQEIRRKLECAEAIDRGMERKGHVFTKVFLAVVSGGITLLPDVISAIEKACRDQTQIVIMPDNWR